MVRQFYLINGTGAEYSLMNVEHWLSDPKNLGAKFNSKYEQIGSTFVRTKRISKPDDIRGTILFTKAQYQTYFDFMKFIAVEPLTLKYVSNATYLCDVDLKQIDKTEIQGGILSCDLRLKRLNRWYRLVTKLNDAEQAGNGKVYSFTYDYTYEENEPETVTIDSDSGYDSPTKITIFGPCTNPVWTQYLNNNIIATGKVNATIQTGRRIVIDSTKIPYSIKEVNNQGTVIRDLYQLSDFTTDRFFFLGYGRNRIVVEHDLQNKLSLAVEGRIEYETV